MSNPPERKKQHYVPRMYLKRWENTTGMLNIISKDDELHIPKMVSSDSELFYTDYTYDIIMPTGDSITNNEVEIELGKYETKHNRLLNRIIANCNADKPVFDKGTTRRIDFIEFVSLLIVRNPYNPIPVQIDGQTVPSSFFDVFFSELLEKEHSISGLQIVANSMDGKLLFASVEILKKLSIVGVSFLKAPEGCSFITSNNPVHYDYNSIHLPLSPDYYAYVLVNKEKTCKYPKNRVSVISAETVKRINRFYWQDDSVRTIVGINTEDLLESLGDN